MEVVDEIINSFTKKRITIRELFHEMHEMGFAFILFFIGLLTMITPPGLTLIVGILPLIFGTQMALGRDYPWIPEWIANKKIKTDTLKAMLGTKKTRDYIVRLEKKLKPRYGYFSSKMGEKIIGGFTILCAISIMIPLPFTNMFPGLAISIMCLGYMGRDGLVIIIGIITGVISSFVGFGIAIAMVWGFIKGLREM